jgi:hypothetical protein
MTQYTIPMDVQTTSPQNFVGTHGTPSGTNDDDSGVLVSDEVYEPHHPMLDVFRQSYLDGWMSHD